MSIFQEKVDMGLEFQIQEDKVCYTPLKEKCDAIRNLESPRLLDKLELFVAWSTFYHLFYLIFVGYLYQYMNI